MTTLAFISAFPPAQGSLNEYGFHLVKAFARRGDIQKIVVLADIDDTIDAELELDPKIEVRRVWKFNSPFASLQIQKSLKNLGPDYALYNLQTASFGDKEIPAALGLMSPMLSQKSSIPSGVIMHNLIDAVDLSKTNLAGKALRQKIVSFAGKIVTKCLLKTGFVSVTLDSFMDILTDKYQAKNAFMVPHGSFVSDVKNVIPQLKSRSNTIVTMGKFGTYKRLERMISAVQNLNSTAYQNHPLKLIIGGSNHPATPGYIEGLKETHKSDANIVFQGYVAEEDVAPFFKQARLAIFDYDSTTGSSGVLHQAAIYGTPSIYPLMGDFVDVTEREGLTGYHYVPLDEQSLTETIRKSLEMKEKSQNIADNNLRISEGVTMDTVAAVQIRLLQRTSPERFYSVRTSTKRALWLKPNFHSSNKGTMS